MGKLVLHLGFIMTGICLIGVGIDGWAKGRVDIHPEVKFLGTVFILFGCLMLFIGSSRYQINRMKHVILIGLISTLSFQFYVISTIVNSSYTTDSIAFSHYAALQTLEGKNPYKYSMLPSLNRFGVPPFFITSHIDGTTEERITYPPLNFLIYIPFILSGIQDMRIVTLLFHVGVFILLYLSAPSGLKPIALFPLLADSRLIDYTASGVTGMMWVFFLLLTALLWKRETLRAVFYSLACLIKPTPWVLAPFLLIRIWQEAGHASLRSRMRKIGIFTLISGSVFLLFNLIFIIHDPKSWFGAVLAPMIAPMVMLGYGLSSLTQAGIWIQPKSFYTLCSFLALIILVIVYFLNFDRVKHTLWFYPGIILWFSYRSLGNYFVYWTPMLMISLYSLYAEYVEDKLGEGETRS